MEQEEVYQDMERWWVGEANCQGLLYDRKILDLDDEDEDLELDLDDDIEDVDVENMLIHFYGYFVILCFLEPFNISASNKFFKIMLQHLKF